MNPRVGETSQPRPGGTAIDGYVESIPGHCVEPHGRAGTQGHPGDGRLARVGTPSLLLPGDAAVFAGDDSSGLGMGDEQIRIYRVYGKDGQTIRTALPFPSPIIAPVQDLGSWIDGVVHVSCRSTGRNLGGQLGRFVHPECFPALLQQHLLPGTASILAAHKAHGIPTVCQEQVGLVWIRVQPPKRAGDVRRHQGLLSGPGGAVIAAPVEEGIVQIAAVPPSGAHADIAVSGDVQTPGEDGLLPGSGG